MFKKVQQKKASKSDVISHAPHATAEELAALQQIAFVPDDEPLDLTKAEKLRTTALMMAITYVEKTICHDAQMYQAIRADGRTLIPATTPHVIQSAINFELFLLGHYSAAKQAAAQAEKEDSGTRPAGENTASAGAGDPSADTPREG